MEEPHRVAILFAKRAEREGRVRTPRTADADARTEARSKKFAVAAKYPTHPEEETVATKAARSGG